MMATSLSSSHWSADATMNSGEFVRLNPDARFVLLALMALTAGTGQRYMPAAAQQLAELCGLTVTRALEALEQLEEAGWISWSGRQVMMEDPRPTSCERDEQPSAATQQRSSAIPLGVQ